MILGSLFTGLGALDTGILATWPGTLAWFAESAGDDGRPQDQRRAAWCNGLVQQRHADAVALGDVTTIKGATLAAVDVLAAGFPCKGISPAGDRAGLTNASSGLWSEVPRILREMASMPTIIIIENSGALPSRGLADVLRDLYALGYDAGWQVVGAVGVGAPHIRARTAIIATRDGTLPAWGPLEPWADRWLAEHWTPAREPSPRVVPPLPRARVFAKATGWRIGAVAALGNAVVLPWAMYVATAARDRVPTAQGIVGALRWRARDRRPRAGVMVDGRVYEAPAVYAESAAVARVLASPLAAVYGALLPTATGAGGGTNQGGAAGRVGPVRPQLSQVAALLPTVVAADGSKPCASQNTATLGRLAAQGALLPTVTTADVRSGAQSIKRGRSGAVDCLRSALLPTASAVDAARGADRRDRRFDSLVTALAPTPTLRGNYNRKGASAASGDGLVTAFRQGRATLLHPVWLAWFMGHDPAILGPVPAPLNAT